MPDAKLGDEFEGRCMRCKLPRPFMAEEINTMKTGAKMAKGPCQICGTTVCRILASDRNKGLSDLLPPTGKKER